MLISKQYKFEGSHVVRGCSTERCRETIHGHSYRVDVCFDSLHRDGGQMVVDFGLLRWWVGRFIDIFDHTHAIWSGESEEAKRAMKSLSQRWIELPVSPSAEGLAAFFFAAIENFRSRIVWTNRERFTLHSVKVHETATGWAEANLSDLLYFFATAEVGDDTTAPVSLRSLSEEGSLIGDHIKMSESIMGEVEQTELGKLLFSFGKVKSPKKV